MCVYVLNLLNMYVCNVYMYSTYISMHIDVKYVCMYLCMLLI